MAARKSKGNTKSKSKSRAKPKTTTKPKTTAKPKGKAQAGRGTKSKKTAFKRPTRSQEAKAPLAEMDAAWQSLLETAIERHREEGAQGAGKPRATKK